MDNGLMLDLAAAAVLVIGLIVGAKRGLWRSLTEALMLIAALLGALLIAGKLADPVTEWVYPKVEDWAVEQAGEAVRTATGGESPAIDPSLLYETLEKLGVPREKAEALLRSVGESAEDTLDEALSGAAKLMVHALAQTALFLLSFLVLILALKLLIGAVDLVMKLPVLSTMNGLGGAIFGLISAAVVLLLVLTVCRRFGVALPEGTHVESLLRLDLTNTILTSLH